jgi:hypothetical protein
VIFYCKLFLFCTLKNIKFTKNIPCSWKKNYFCRPVLSDKSIRHLGVIPALLQQTPGSPVHMGNGVCWSHESAYCMRNVLQKPNTKSKQHVHPLLHVWKYLKATQQTDGWKISYTVTWSQIQLASPVTNSTYGRRTGSTTSGGWEKYSMVGEHTHHSFVSELKKMTLLYTLIQWIGFISIMKVDKMKTRQEKNNEE